MNEAEYISNLISVLNDVFNPLAEGQQEEEREINIPILPFPDNVNTYEFLHPLGSIYIKSGQVTAQIGGVGIKQRQTAYQSKMYLLSRKLNDNGIYDITTKILNRIDGMQTGKGKPYFKMLSEPVYINDGEGYWERVITFVVPGVKTH